MAKSIPIDENQTSERNRVARRVGEFERDRNVVVSWQVELEVRGVRAHSSVYQGSI